MFMPELLEVEGLIKDYTIRTGSGKKANLRALDDVRFSMSKGETFAVVGESGSGKTTLGRCVVRAIDPTAGQIIFDGGPDIASLRGKELKQLRRRVQLVFQDPYSSLNPRMTVEDIIAEPLICNRLASGKALDRRISELLQLVGLSERHRQRYPHAFSGGQRQRIGIARALATSPELIVCDEAVSALDVSVQAQILNLLADLRDQLGTSYLFISHDLSVVRFIANRVGVMYLGRFVETGSRDDIFERPLHPYTEALLSARPTTDPTHRTERIVLSGEPASPARPPSGCPFNPRCRYAQDICRTEKPAVREFPGGRTVACHFDETLELQGATTDASAA
jgi:peptide/nickel transport system ATP-binding protein